MSIEKPANERLKLYERFKKSLASGADAEAEFFDADDLIIVIDQAVDLDDQYVEIEAIMRGYRFFPDNEELRSRRAFLYFDLNLDQGVEDIQQTLPAESPMTKILNLRQNAEAQNEQSVLKVLNSIAESPEKLDDETIIQLVDCASACNCYDWLKENEKRLRKKTDYLPTLLYELFIVADLHHDRDYCIRLLEELTELEPFNVDFWNALAQILVNIGDGPNPNEPDFEGALTTLEYALAIEPENIQALTLKASILVEIDRAKEAVDALAPFEKEMSSETAAEVYLRALYLAGRLDRAKELATTYCTQWPESEGLIHFALFAEPEELDALIQNHFNALESTENFAENWVNRAKTYYSHGDLSPALKMLSALKNNDLLDYSAMKLYITCLYCMDMFDECIAEFNDIIDNREEFLMPCVVIGGIMAYLKKGEKRPAKQAMKKLMDKFPLHIRDTWTLASNLESIGMSQFIAAVNAILNSTGPIDASAIDIFDFPSSTI